MSFIQLISIKAHVKEFCSQNRSALPPVRTLEECVKIIVQILEKDTLCKHDIDDINHLYANMELLERQVDKISPENSRQFILQHMSLELTKVKHNLPSLSVGISFPKTSTKFKELSSKKWIWLYHLQNFSDERLHLKGDFNYLSKAVCKTSADLREIAVHLPFCVSKDQFNKDVQALIGDHPSPEVTEILDQKLKKFNNYEILKPEIANRKKKLQNLRKKNPDNYPTYLDELLDHGYIHLYDHLLEMRALPTRNDRRATVENISFSSLAHIVLETKEAIILKVKESIHTENKNVLFLLGSTGAGKSTTLCFLRGDTMVLKGFQYESQNDQKHLIGTSTVHSCTFLPTVEIVNDLVIIDFPGFDDSNGSLISLGMEFALKALIKKYKAKVLVIEAITNTEGKYAAAAQLGARLKRLFENKKDCFLGITKYSKDPYFGQIQKIEEDQKNELITPSPQEKAYEVSIRTLSDLNMPDMPDIQKKIQKLQEQLSQLKQEKIQKQQLPLLDTPLKKQNRDELQKKENELLHQIGLEKIIRLWNLEDPKHLSSCLETLTDPKNKVICVKSQPKDPIMDPILDSYDKELIQRRFENNLRQEIENHKDCYIKDVKLFMQKVLESSLINTILSQTHPEIGQFFHVPETDFTLVNNFDKAVVRNCIKKYMKSIISDLDMSHIDALLQELITKISKDKLETLEKLKVLDNSAKKLRNCVFGFLGVCLENPEQARKKWEEIRAEYKSRVKVESKGWKLSPWVQVLMGVPAGIPLGIYKLLQWNVRSNIKQQAIDDLINNASKDLDRIYESLVMLKDLEKIIEKREKLNEAFHSLELLSIAQLERDLVKLIQNKIKKIREIYDSEDWDKRINTIKDSYICQIEKEGSDNNFLNYNLRPLNDEEVWFLHRGIPSPDISFIKYGGKDGVFVSLEKMLSIFTRLCSPSSHPLVQTMIDADRSHPLVRTILAAAIFSICENTQPSSTTAVQTQVINSKS